MTDSGRGLIAGIAEAREGVGRGHTRRRDQAPAGAGHTQSVCGHHPREAGDRAGDGTVAETIARILTVEQLTAWLTAWSGPEEADFDLDNADGTPLGEYLVDRGYDCWIDHHGLTPAGEPDTLIPLPPALVRFDALCAAWPGDVITAGEALALLHQAARNDDGDGEE